jgi:serine/threonine protein kinase
MPVSLPVLGAIGICLTLAVAALAFLILGELRREPVHPCPTCGHPTRMRGRRCERCSRPVPADAPYLVYQNGSATNQVAIPPTGLTIGRHPDNDLRLEARLVSRRHARIEVNDGKYVIWDTGSANGTWVNDQRVDNRALRTGDEIQIGDTRFVYRSSEQPAKDIPAAHYTGDPRPGQWIDGYQLEDVIGRGGMSVVYRAVDRDGHAVAINILQETQQYLVEKFEQEGKSIGPLLRRHPHIVQVHGFGKTEDGRHYIIMEYVEGASLRRELGQPIDDIPFIQQIVGQTCDALNYAHQCGVIHRDIKPENILLTPEGDVKIADFGVAKVTSAVTVTHNQIVGTPEYMSYEQARGERVNVGSDVYSLGVVLYEMLTGDVPFRRPLDRNGVTAAMKVVDMHIKEPPQPPSERYPEVDRLLERIVLRALEKDWKKRFRSAPEMARSLGWRHFTDLQPPVTYPVVVHFKIVGGPMCGGTVTIRIERPEGAWIGREDIDPQDNRLSRRHAILMYRAGRLWIEDQSTNGTFLNAERVRGESQLRAGDVLRMGRCEVQLIG